MKAFILIMATAAFSISCHSGAKEKVAFNVAPDLIIINGKVALPGVQTNFAQALASKGGKITKVGPNDEILQSKGDLTVVIDVKGKTVIPGLNDSHSHNIRGGRFYNSELRWDGVKSLKRALQMLKEQADRTPPGQWVRVIGGWSPYQFEEKRMPTPAEINDAAPTTPVFVLFLYSKGWLNRAGLRALKIDEYTVALPQTRYEKGPDGKLTGAVLAEPSPDLLYKIISQLPSLNEAEIVNSTAHFFRELNSFGMTSFIDAGGGGHKFPENYAGTAHIARAGEMPIRVSYYLFPQNIGKELEEFKGFMHSNKISQNGALDLDHGYELEGAGEFLVYSAGDWENFLAQRPKLAARRNWRQELKEVLTLLVTKKWSFRLHTTYGETISQVLDLLEEIDKEHGLKGLRWAIDHAETIKDEDLQRIKTLGGGISVQNRMAYAGEYFVSRYGKTAARTAPPLRKILDSHIPLGAGTDGTRVSSYNPWHAIYWMVTGKTMGGALLYEGSNKLTRTEALQALTNGAAWFSQEEMLKGLIQAGMYADFAVLSADYFTIPEEEIKNLSSHLTVVNGKVVYATGDFQSFDKAPDEIIPSWSPVRYFGGFQLK